MRVEDCMIGSEMPTRSQAIGVSATRRECEAVRYEVWDFRQVR